MAQFKFKLISDKTGWNVTDPVTDETLVTITLPADAEQLRNLALYGLKQVCGDGAAKDKGTSRAARVRALVKRHEEIHSGLWNMRDGTGAGGLPDADIYRALVALGLAPDTADQRDKWKKLPASHRRAIAKRTDVAEWIEANASTSVDADEALESFITQ